MSKSSVVVAYDGKDESLKNHSMDMKELAFALSGMAELFEEANLIVNGSKTTTKVQVKSFSQGSFEIHFDVLLQSGLNIFGDQEVSGALNLVQILIYGTAGSLSLIQLIKKIKNYTITKVTERKNLIQIEIETEKGLESFEIQKPVYDLFLTVNAKKAFYKALKPLEAEGIDFFQIKEKKGNETKIIEQIAKEELQYFNQESRKQKINEDTRTVYLNIVSISFKDGNKWKFFDGEREFFATIDDNEFIYKVDNNLPITKSDTFKVELKITQYNTEEGLKTDYSVKKILEHKSATQLRLDLFKKKEN